MEGPLKKHLISLLKFAFVTALIYWLVKTDKITAEPFLKMVQTPWLIPFAFGTVLVLILINNYRWQLLLMGQSIPATMRQTLPLTFIGLFFNLAMPGSVGGDVMKAYFIARDQPGTKLRAATTVLMDRIVGMYAMSVLALVSVLLNWNQIMSSAKLHGLAIFIFCMNVGLTAFFVVGFSSRIKNMQLLQAFFAKVPGGRTFERLYHAIHDFRAGQKQFVWGFLLSLFGQSIMVVSYYIIGQALHFDNLTLNMFFFVIPLGLIATAVPVSPGGVGVGQAVFLALFTWYQGSQSTLGPTLITINQVVMAIFSCFGAVFYFLRRPAKGQLESTT